MHGYICIHGHFYQPPRENPWLERIEVQDSAHPYHDWNARVHAECYAPNAVSRILDERGSITAIVNNYEHISFNFGPTLLGWIEENDPEIYRKIVQADRISGERHDGHGNAMAQPYNHMIMPLANRRDKLTQLRWGIASFRKHFNRAPEGMWLPETAVDLETLELLSECGIRFTILAPRQARRVRPLNSTIWCEVNDGTIDPTMPYLVRLPSGDCIAVFFYHGEIAHDLAFGGLLQNAENFEQRLLQALPAGRDLPPLAHVATDGETYGHHHRFGDMALAYTLDQVRKNPEVGLTNYGEYLARCPPTHEVEIVGHSSWSCVHGVERWRGDCGCRIGANPGWNQKWRKTLRESLDWLRHELIGVYVREASPLFKNPWQARDEYINVIMDRSDLAKGSFLQIHAARALSAPQRCRTWQLLEMQRNAMLMYTSCGWFFDELSGIETVQILCYAARAIELAQLCAGKSLAEEFTERLRQARSNINATGTGAEVYRNLALAAKAGFQQVAIHCAISSFFENDPQKNRLGCYTVELKEYASKRHEQTVAAAGLLHARSTITEQEASFLFATLQQEPHDYSCAVKECSAGSHVKADPCLTGKLSYPQLTEELFGSLTDKGPSAALSIIDRSLGQDRYTIRDLFKDEQQQLLNALLEGEIEYVSKTLEAVYERTAFLTTLLEACGHPLPTSFTMAAEVTLKRKLVTALENPKTKQETIRLLLDEISRCRLSLDAEWLEQILRAQVEQAMALVRTDPRAATLKGVNAQLSLLSLFPVKINLWQAQNIYFDLLESLYSENKSKADQGETEAGHWLAEFNRLGARLLINVEKVLAGMNGEERGREKNA